MSDGGATFGSVAGPPPDAAARRAELAAALVATGRDDRDAFRRVYRMTSAKLYGICLRICGERQAAEDVLQDVYAQVWRRAGGFEPARSSPVTWLATIARNRAIDWRRANNRPPPVELPELADPAPGAEAMMLEADLAARIRFCLEELEARQRTAIRTAFFDGMTYAELAAREAVPLGTMKSVIRRGLMKLRGCLADDA